LQPLLEPHRSYLEGRGFDPEELERIWDLSFLGLVPRLAWRIWIPVHLNGEIVSWTTRTIGKTKGPKYINANPEEEVHPIKSLLYGWDYVRSSVIICEGPSDVWRIGPGSVCVLGVNVSDSQMQLLSQVPRRVVCFDNEPLAQRGAEKLCNELSTYPGETTNVRLDSSDPGCADREEVETLRSFLE
jgi:DNA primase